MYIVEILFLAYLVATVCVALALIAKHAVREPQPVMQEVQDSPRTLFESVADLQHVAQ